MMLGSMGWLPCWLSGFDSCVAWMAALVADGGEEFGQSAVLMMASSKMMRGTGIEFPAARQILRVVCGDGLRLSKVVVLG